MGYGLALRFANEVTLKIWDMLCPLTVHFKIRGDILQYNAIQIISASWIVCKQFPVCLNIVWIKQYMPVNNMEMVI